MTLDKSYLEYENRSLGMDHDRYDFSNMFERKPVSWPDGKKVALWITVSLEYFPLVPNDGPFKAPGHMVTPYPDYRTYTTRDYGNRVGVFRILKVLDKLGLKASFPMNSEIATRYPSLLKEITDRGHEVVAHGENMNKIHFGGMAKNTEAEQINNCVKTLREKSGQGVTGWQSPARSQSENTPDLLVTSGLGYVCDWVNDDMPYYMRAKTGTIIAMPHTMELEDRNLLVTLGQSEEVYKEQILAAFSQFQREAMAENGRVLHLALTPYVIGQPWRIRTLVETLQAIADSGDIWSATGGEIAAIWDSQQTS